MNSEYPDPYPMADTSKLARILPGIHFRKRTVLSIVGNDGKELVIPVKKGDGILDQFKTVWDFVHYDPASGQEKNIDKGEASGNNNTVPVDEDEYIPQDIEQTEGEKQDGFWQIDPPLSGYYYSGVKSYFDPHKMTWSKRKSLSPYTQNPNLNTKKSVHLFSGTLGSGTFSLPLPRGSQIDMTSVSPVDLIVSVDQNGCFYATTTKGGAISFKFYTGQGYITQGVIFNDLERIDRGGFTQVTQVKLQQYISAGKSGASLAMDMCNYIKNSKKYNVKFQAHIHRTSTTNNYIYNLDASEVLECYSANTLFIALARAIGVPSRLCLGHRLDSQNIKDKKSHISNNTGHAWSEIWDGSKWILTDATPIQQDQNIVDDAEKKEKEENKKMEEMGFDPDSEADKKLYSEYQDIHKEVAPEIRRLIAKLEAMLPKIEDVYVEKGFKSGELDNTQLVNWKVEGKQNIFQRNIIEQFHGVMNLFEAIVLDRSGSMSCVMSDGKTRMQHVTRTAVIRAEVLAHFGIPTLLILFDDTPDCVMEWAGSVSGKKTNGAPARIMHGSVAGGGNDFTQALRLAYEKLEQFSSTKEGIGRKGNITFVSDGETYEVGLEALISQIAQKYPTTAYYLGNDSGSGSLRRYFGDKNTIVVENPRELAKKMADRFDKTLRKELQKLLPFSP